MATAVLYSSSWSEIKVVFAEVVEGASSSQVGDTRHPMFINLSVRLCACLSVCLSDLLILLTNC